MCAFVIYLIANFTGSVFSIGYLPVVILAPIGAISLVFNAVAARVVLGDPFTRQSVLGNNTYTHPYVFMGHTIVTSIGMAW